MEEIHPNSSVKPLIVFGVVTDIQYADYDNLPAAYDPDKIRFYRDSLFHVDNAFKFWEDSTNPVHFVLQLGDIIDGLNHELGVSNDAVKNVLSKFESHCVIPAFHTIGNHELYNFGRLQVAKLFFQSMKSMNIPAHIFNPADFSNFKNLQSLPVLYYKFCPIPTIKCISLDCFDISILGYDATHPKFLQAAKVLQFHHGHNNCDLWDSNDFLEGLNVRFQSMNGAIGKEQLEWLEKELGESDKLKQEVIVFGHVGLNPDSTDWSCLLWNYDEVISTFHRHECVIAYLSGHSHVSGYTMDSYGIHYLVFAGVIETPPNSEAFATVSVFPDRMEVLGCGRERSYTLKIKHGAKKNISISESPESEFKLANPTRCMKTKV